MNWVFSALIRKPNRLSTGGAGQARSNQFCSLCSMPAGHLCARRKKKHTHTLAVEKERGKKKKNFMVFG